ncbi:MAG: ribosome small subunit-dependent GTPase A [Porphyromonadaceae bacterium]|nr:ribosome small subunit-dependent GTPase A [Porphyromonadaceae bacterium]
METRDGIMTIEATVVKHTGSHYLLSRLPEWDVFPAVLRGKIRLKGSVATNPIAVGDKVICEIQPNGNLDTNGGNLNNDPKSVITSAPDEPTLNVDIRDIRLSELVSYENPALIKEILPRKNYVIRRSVNLSRQAHIIAANIDRAFIIVTLDFPEIKLPFIDRLLVTCEVYNVRSTIVLNKMDLYTEDYAEQLQVFHEIYEGAGYEIIEVSAETGFGVEKLREACRDRVSLFSGVSGVGKSALIKALDPSINPRIGELSEAYLQGRHTTTFYEMYQLCSGGFIIDTPGIRGFGLVDLKKEEIALYFPEMLRESRGCRFTPCTHTHEPGCAVKAAVEEGRISWERYNSYLGMLNDEDEGKYRPPQ